MPPVPLTSAPRFRTVLLALGLLSVAALLLRGRQAQLKALAVGAALEGPARRQGYAKLSGDLEKKGQRLGRRLAGAADTEANRETARHIIGIERWGQARLQALENPENEGRAGLGGHRPYRPDDRLDLVALRALAAATRGQTADLARHFEVQPPSGQVEHNGLGPLSAGAWLRYLTLHAEIESRRLK